MSVAAGESYKIRATRTVLLYISQVLNFRWLEEKQMRLQKTR